MKKRSKKKKRNATHVAPRKQPPRSPAAVLLDEEDKQLVIFTADMLINQLRREGPKIEMSFDKLCDHDLLELSELFSKTSGLLYTGLKVALRHDQRLMAACAQLLINASNSFGAAIALLRVGYVLQPGIIIRSLLEAVSTVLHLLQYPHDLKSYEQHTLQSPKTIAAAKKALPPFGQLYGYFSDNFAHIGQLHKSITRLSEYKNRDPALEVNLSFFRIAAWLLYVTTELLCNELIEEPRYWYPVANGYVYNPSHEEREWMSEFFRLSDLSSS